MRSGMRVKGKDYTHSIEEVRRLINMLRARISAVRRFANPSLKPSTASSNMLRATMKKEGPGEGKRIKFSITREPHQTGKNI